MSNIRIEDIKPGDEVQVGGLGHMRIVHQDNLGLFIVYADTPIPLRCMNVTMHKPAKPEPPAEWLGECDAIRILDISSIDYAHDALQLRDAMNRLLSGKYGPPPVPRVYKKGDVLPRCVLWWDGEDWLFGAGAKRRPGEIWLPQPPAPEGIGE